MRQEPFRSTSDYGKGNRVMSRKNPNAEENEKMSEAISEIEKVVKQYRTGTITEAECLTKITVYAYDSYFWWHTGNTNRP